MIIFYGYNDGQALAVQNRKVYLRIALYSLIAVIPFTVIGIIRTEYFWFFSWAFPLFFLFLSILTFFFVKYDNEVFLKGLRKKHLFKVENVKIYKDGKEIKRINKIRLYKHKNYLLMKTADSFFRIPDDEYLMGSRTELLQTMIVNRNHTVWLRLPPKTVEEKRDLLFREIRLEKSCRLFYSKNKEHILYICRREDGFFSVGAERLILADDAELDLFKVYGWWEPDNITKSIFETEEMAYNDIKNAIVDYDELKI